MTALESVAKNKLIVALDVERAQQARELASTLRDIVGMFKIGSQLFTAAGPDLVREIIKAGGRVFLDLKFHDIPNTVAAAAVEATRLGVSIFNVHASGGSEMMRRTAEAAAHTAEVEGLVRPAVIAVTVLTSADSALLKSIGTTVELEEHVRRLAVLAADSMMDGVVASSHEVPLIRSAVKKSHFLIVTPGVRPSNTAAQDQRRIMTPAQAIKAGADYLVVGRPIIAAPDPSKAALAIVREMESSLA